MKKSLFAAWIICVMVMGCKKDDSSTPSNTYTVNGTSYTLYSTNGFTINGNRVSISGISGTTGGSLIFSFKHSPVAGTYKVVDYNTTTQADDELIFQATALSTLTPYSCQSTGTKTVNATVVVNAGKITISMPDAPAKQTIGGSAIINVNCNATQQ